jgi:hypothetical protein
VFDGAWYCIVSIRCLVLGQCSLNHNPVRWEHQQIESSDSQPESAIDISLLPEKLLVAFIPRSLGSNNFRTGLALAHPLRSSQIDNGSGSLLLIDLMDLRIYDLLPISWVAGDSPWNQWLEALKVNAPFP